MQGNAFYKLNSRFVGLVLLNALLGAQAGDFPQRENGAFPQATKALPMEIPLVFEPYENTSAPEVHFVSRGQGYTLFLASREVALVRSETSHSPGHRSREDRQGTVNEGLHSSVVRMK